MKNKLSDLNDHLFAQLERLGEEGIKPEQLKAEVERSKAMAQIASNIIEGARVTLDAHIAAREHNLINLLPMIETTPEKINGHSK